MLAQQSGEKYWSLVETKQLSANKRYLFLIAIPGAMQDCCDPGSAADLLTKQGWGGATPGTGMTFSAPPDAYKQAMQVLVSQNLPTPQVWQVIGTWNGVEGAVLPTNLGQIYFGPVYVELDVVAPPTPDQQPAPAPSASVAPSVWPSVVGFLVGTALIGGAWMYVRKNVTHAPRMSRGMVEESKESFLKWTEYTPDFWAAVGKDLGADKPYEIVYQLRREDGGSIRITRSLSGGDEDHVVTLSGLDSPITMNSAKQWVDRHHAKLIRTFVTKGGHRFEPSAGEQTDDDDDFDLQGEMETGLIIGEHRGRYTLSLEGSYLNDYVDFNSALKAAAQTMENKQYWPNVFYVNERGNTDLLAVRAKIIKGNVIKAESKIIRSWV